MRGNTVAINNVLNKKKTIKLHFQPTLYIKKWNQQKKFWKINKKIEEKKEEDNFGKKRKKTHVEKVKVEFSTSSILKKNWQR